MKNAGLKIAPNFISLECCQAATESGIALELSKHPFFKDTIIEATETSIYRDFGKHFSGKYDDLGRQFYEPEKKWFYFYNGEKIAEKSLDFNLWTSLKVSNNRKNSILITLCPDFKIEKKKTAANNPNCLFQQDPKCTFIHHDTCQNAKNHRQLT